MKKTLIFSLLLFFVATSVSAFSLRSSGKSMLDQISAYLLSKFSRSRTITPRITTTPSPTVSAILNTSASQKSRRTSTPTPKATLTPTPTPTLMLAPTKTPTPIPTATATPIPNPFLYPLHTNITATVFWVGEPVGNGSSEDNAISAYDDFWQTSYGGYDDYSYIRTLANNYFPTTFTPKENPFYLDLPYDDLNVGANFNTRTSIIPWAIGQSNPRNYSFIKNHWVKIQKGTAVCYGQIEDAGPYVYNDANYVFGANDARPVSTQAKNAGMDVSPALRDCLGFTGLNNADNKVNWQFVNESDVPFGPWKIIITTSQVNQP